MTDHLKQSISALLDEEVSEIEVHRLLREFESDETLKHTWVRYQQIRAVSQGHHHLSESQHLDLHSRISAALDEEEHHDWQSESRPSWQKNTAGLAVAASLVMAVFVGVNLQQQGTSPASDLVATSEPAPVVDVQPVSTEAQPADGIVAFNEDDMQLKELNTQELQRLREYLMRHDRSSQLNQMSETQTVTFPAGQAPASSKSRKN